MGCLGNLLWFLFGGFALGVSWLVAGIIWCITIVGIPVGMQCFKIAGLVFFPFGKEVKYGGGVGSLLLNICGSFFREFHLLLRLWQLEQSFVLQLSEFHLGCSALRLPN